LNKNNTDKTRNHLFNEKIIIYYLLALLYLQLKFTKS
jgi:hypothetical protein